MALFSNEVNIELLWRKNTEDEFQWPYLWSTG